MTPEQQVERLIEVLETDLKFARRWWELRRAAQAAETAGDTALTAKLDRQAQMVVWRTSRLHKAATRLTRAFDDVAADVEGDRRLHASIEAGEAA